MISKILKFFNLNSTKLDITKSIILFFLSILNALFQIFFISTFYIIIEYLLGNEPSINSKLINFTLNYFKNGKDLILLCLVILFLSLLIQLIYSFLSNKWITLFVQKLEINIFNQTLNKKVVFFKKVQSYNYIKKIIDNVPRLSMGVFFPVLNIIASYFIITLYIIFLLNINYKITLITLLLICSISFFIFYFIKKKLIKISTNENYFLKERIKFINDTITYFRDIKIYNLNKLFLKKFLNVSKGYFESRYRSYFYSSFPKTIFEFLIFSILLFVLLILFFNKGNSFENHIPTASIYLLVIYKLVPCFMSLLSSYANISANIKFFDIVEKEYNNLNKDLEPTINYSQNKNLKINTINLQNISFNYEEKNIVNNINITLKKGESLILTGETGAGKSTILDIISGLIYQNNGKIILNNNIEVEKNIFNELRSKISYVSQNSDIFEESIYDNVTLNFDEKINSEKILKDNKFQNILNLCLIDKLLKNKNISPFDTLLEKGRDLSGGEKQRIIIGRALYKNCDILILDEATSALNTDIEKKILKNIIDFCTDKIFILCTHNIHLKNMFSKHIEIKKTN